VSAPARRAARPADDHDDDDEPGEAAQASERPSRLAPYLWSWAPVTAFLGWLASIGHMPGHTAGSRLVWFVVLDLLLTVLVRVGGYQVRHNGRDHLARAAGGLRTAGGAFVDGWTGGPARGPGPAPDPPVQLVPRPAAADPPRERQPARTGGRRHRRPGAGRTVAAPAHWAAACAALGDLIPDGISDTEQAMLAERAGISSYGSTVDGWADQLVGDVGYDERAVAGLRKTASALTGAAAEFEAAWRQVAVFYEDHIRHAEDGEHAPHDGRHFEK
jgi:hypothetical protein